LLTGERLGLNPSAAVALLEHVRDPHRRRDLLHSALAKSDVIAITVAERVESLRLLPCDAAWRRVALDRGDLRALRYPDRGTCVRNTENPSRSASRTRGGRPTVRRAQLRAGTGLTRKRTRAAERRRDQWTS
jgi:hypothetical protein